MIITDNGRVEQRMVELMIDPDESVVAVLRARLNVAAVGFQPSDAARDRKDSSVARISHATKCR